MEFEEGYFLAFVLPGIVGVFLFGLIAFWRI
jgi:hypothetical protein